MNTHYHFHLSKLLCVLGFVLVFFQNSYSQRPGSRETVDFINKTLEGKCKIHLNGAMIIADFYSHDGTKIRQDKLSSGALDTAVVYDSSEQILSAPCIKAEGDCVTRTLYIQKIKRPYSRFSIPVNSETQANEVRIALKHLIRLLSEPKYKDEITFY